MWISYSQIINIMKIVCIIMMKIFKNVVLIIGRLLMSKRSLLMVWACEKSTLYDDFFLAFESLIPWKRFVLIMRY